MPIGDFDYKILSHVSKVEETTMESLCKKFSTKARPSVANLYKQGYLNWQPSKSSALSHDDTSPITLSRTGTIELNNHRESGRISLKWLFITNFVSVILGLVIGAVWDVIPRLIAFIESLFAG